MDHAWPWGPSMPDATHCEKWLRKSHSCWKRLAEARYARMKSYYTAVSTSAAVLVGMLAL